MANPARQQFPFHIIGCKQKEGHKPAYSLQDSGRALCK